MSMVRFVFEPTTSVMGCGDHTYRCVNPDGSVGDDWAKTKACMDTLGIFDDCYCSHRAEYYAVPGSKVAVDAFIKCCEGYHNFGARQC